MAEDLVAIAWKPIEAFNNGDWDAYRAGIADDIVSEELATGRTTHGADEDVALTGGWKVSFPDGNGTLDASYVSGDTVIMEITWRGSQTGPFPLLDGTEFPPSGRRVEMPAVMIATIKDGKVKKVRHLFDLLTMLTQIGAVPK